MAAFLGIRVFVFDFDGTLVQSNEIKRSAFFDLFSGCPRSTEIIEKVLAKSHERSRYEIIEAILEQLPKDFLEKDSYDEYVRCYSEIVLRRTKMCEDVKNAKSVLQSLSSNYPIYLSSLTPESPLAEIVRFRGWEKYFSGIFGYPRRKEESLEFVMKKEGVTSSEILVIGDGESDRLSAEKVKCHFLKACATHDLWQSVYGQVI